MQPFNSNANNPNISQLHSYLFPVDNVDRASVTTVNPTAASLANDIHFMMRAGASLRPHIAMRCADSANISVFAHGFTYAFNGTKWIPQLKSASFTITPAGLIADTWYYVYMKTNNLNIGDPPYEVSLTPPELTLTFKTADQTQRYMGSFLTNAVGIIVPFGMVDFDYDFGVPLDTNFSNLAGPFAGPGPSDIIIPQISPLAKKVKLVTRLTSLAGATQQLNVTVAPKELISFTSATWQGYTVNPIICGGDADSQEIKHDFYQEFPLFASKRLVAQVQAPVISLKGQMWWVGFKE
jgi:hypothetical protein